MTTPPPDTRVARVSPRRDKRPVFLTMFYSLVTVIIGVLLWEWFATTNRSMYFPAPSAVWENMLELFLSEDQLFSTAITVDMVSTLWRTLLGFALGSLFGVIFGALIGRSIIARDVSNPIIEFLRSIPATATLPLFIILLGGSDGMRIAFISYSVMWYVLLNAAKGVTTIHPTVINLGKIFRLSTSRQFFTLILPAALPKVFAGLKIAITVALLVALVSEFMLSSNGIGFQLLVAQAEFNMKNLWSWIVVLALIGFALNTVMDFIERRVLKWDRLANRSDS